jgi:Na+-transporting methylmalonyl-CoA/oxaloacetate decarboxylase gamma subunit
LNNSILDGLNLFWIGTTVVFLVLIVLLVSINLLTFFENKFFQKKLKNKNVINQENGENLFEVAAAIAVSLFKKSKNRTNEIAAAVAVSMYENSKTKTVISNMNSIQSSWITINRSRMIHKKSRRV